MSYYPQQPNPYFQMPSAPVASAGGISPAIVIVIIIVLLLAFTLVFLFTRPASKIGETCLLPIDCEGNNVFVGKGTTCDLGKCVEKKKDWAGFWYPPSQCKDAPAPLGGSCGRGYHWLRKENEPCDTDQACEGFAFGQQGLACDNKVCVQKVQSDLGIWFKPSEIKK